MINIKTILYVMNITEQLKDKLNEAVKAIFEGYKENTKIAEDGVELLQDFIDTYGLENKMLYVDSGFVFVNDIVLDTWQLDIMQEGEALKAKLDFYPLSDYITIDDEIDTEAI